MLIIHRRHVESCSHKSRTYRKCACPIWIDWRVGGKRVQKPIGTADWTVAQLRAREMEATGLTSAGQDVTIENAVDGFEKDAENNIQPSTLKQYKILLTRLKAFSKHRGYIFLKQLGVVQIRDFRNSWTTYSPRTAGKHIERLKRFFTWCVENQWIPVSPAKPLKPPKVGQTDVVPFSEKEVEAILKACENYEGPNREKLTVLTNVMLATGLAIGDAAMLSKKRLVKSTTDWVIELRREKTGTAVACPIPSGLAKAIQSLKGDTPFWSGQSDLEDLTKNWRKIYTKIFEAAGLEGHPHQFRPTRTMLLSLGQPRLAWRAQHE